MKPSKTPGLKELPDVSGKTVLVRVDFNVPLEGGRVADDNRIVGALPTLHWLRERGARLVLCSHLGRPKGAPNPKLSLLPAAARLAELLDAEVVFAHATIGDDVVRLVREQPRNGVVVLENLRFDAREKAGDATFARALAAHADLFVNDAFGAMHRPHASITGVPALLPSACGLLVEKELDALGRLLGSSGRAGFAAVLGGAKVSDKLGVIRALLRRCDQIFIGGAMAYTVLRAQGVDVGTSRVEADRLDDVRSMLAAAAERDVRIHLPIDHVVAKRFALDAPAMVVENIPDDAMGLDIGPATVATWRDALARSRTVFWNGPMGVFEWDAFAAGTRGLADCLAGARAKVVVGGGDSAAAIRQFGLADQVAHVSTGGGAALEFLENGDLPGLQALRQRRSP